MTISATAGDTLGPTTAAVGGPSVYVTDKTEPYQLSDTSSAVSIA